MRKLNEQRGNVLFIILICVALFALLAWAVTRSGNTSTVGKKAQTALDATEIVQYANSLRLGVQRLNAARGCNPVTLNFYSSKFTGYIAVDRTNADAPTDGTCDIFSSTGGGVTWQAPPTSSIALGATFYTITGQQGVSGVGTEAFGDIMIFTYVTQDVCIKINDEMGITNPSGLPPVEAQGVVVGAAATDFITSSGHNTYNDALNATTKVDSAQLVNKKSGCFSSTANSKYYFYAVLLPR